MDLKYIQQIAAKQNLSLKQINSVHQLQSEGATIPFMARYRKEATGNLDEVAIGNVMEQIKYFEELDKTQHSVGPGEPKALAALEMLDGLLGELLEEYEHDGLGKRLVTCIVADHGFERVDKTFKPNAVLRAAGPNDEENGAYGVITPIKRR